jgi:hypothetical protein
MLDSLADERSRTGVPRLKVLGIGREGEVIQAPAVQRSRKIMGLVTFLNIRRRGIIIGELSKSKLRKKKLAITPIRICPAPRQYPSSTSHKIPTPPILPPSGVVYSYTARPKHLLPLCSSRLCLRLILCVYDCFCSPSWCTLVHSRVRAVSW